LKLLRSPFTWCATTYFAEGFPYSLVRQISSVYFKDHHASLPAIGMTSLYGLPWALKFLWAPYLDRYGTKRKWILILEGLLCFIILAFAGMSQTPAALTAGAFLFMVIAFTAATHDIAIDGYYLEALDRKGQAKFVGYRVMAYRLALIAGAGGVITLSHFFGWPAALGAAALVLLLLLLYHAFFLPTAERETLPLKALLSDRSGRRIAGIGLAGLLFAVVLYLGRHWPPLGRLLIPFEPLGKILSPAGWISLTLFAALLVLLALRNRIRKGFLGSDSFYANAFLTFLDQRRIGWALAFIVLYRTGESLLAAMTAPFLLDLGINKAQYGLLSGTFGILFSILGALAGGACIARYSLSKTIWPFTLAQNLTNVVYMAMAYHYRELFLQEGTAREVSLLFVGSVHCFDQFAGGLGTAVFSFYLMRCCRPEFKASHFAIVSGIMSVGGIVFGITSGFLASWLGYWRFFGLSFFASIPGMCLIAFIPFLKEEQA
jgi:PAT family beta-lactamase induction signal transducer AmpG